MLRYFFPPAFRISKDDVNSMAAEELVAFPLVRPSIDEQEPRMRHVNANQGHPHQMCFLPLLERVFPAV